jgi:hypothetical protein
MLNNTGSKDTNALVRVLTCETTMRQVCGDVERKYTLCHKSIMGTGEYEGRQDCGLELSAFFDCAKRVDPKEAAAPGAAAKEFVPYGN